MSVYKRRDSGKWIIDITYTHPDGRKEIVRKNSPVQTKRGAEQYEAQLRQAMLQQDSMPKEKPPCPIFRDYAEAFMTNCAEVENKPSEILSKERTLRNHLFPAFGKKPLDLISRDGIKAFRSKQLKDGYSPKTINNHVAVLNRILGEAVEAGILDFVPRVRRLKSPPPESKFLTEEEAVALVNAAEEPWKYMILLGLTTGLRQGELLALQWRDINRERRFLMVRHSIFRGRMGSPKSNKERPVPLNDDAMEALNSLCQNGEFVFCNDQGKPWTDNQCKWPLIRASKSAGIRHVSWHMLRHTFASHLVQHGTSIMEVQKYLGHSDIRTTQRYAYLNPEIRHDEVRKLPSYRTYAAQNVVQFCKAAE